MRARAITRLRCCWSRRSRTIAGGVRCGGDTRSCKQGTLFVTVSFGGTTNTADQVSVLVLIDGVAPAVPSLRDSGPPARPGTPSRSPFRLNIPWASASRSWSPR